MFNFLKLYQNCTLVRNVCTQGEDRRKAGSGNGNRMVRNVSPQGEDGRRARLGGDPLSNFGAIFDRPNRKNLDGGGAQKVYVHCIDAQMTLARFGCIL